ncbi:MAG: hypothetical protein ABIO94_02495 [Opitutaceae bacterium]
MKPISFSVILNEVKNPRFRWHYTWILRSAQNDKRWFDGIAMIDLGKFIARYTQFALADCSVSQNDKPGVY